MINTKFSSGEKRKAHERGFLAPQKKTQATDRLSQSAPFSQEHYYRNFAPIPSTCDRPFHFPRPVEPTRRSKGEDAVELAGGRDRNMKGRRRGGAKSVSFLAGALEPAQTLSKSNRTPSRKVRSHSKHDRFSQDKHVAKMERMQYALKILTNTDKKETRRIVLQGVKEAVHRRKRNMLLSLIGKGRDMHEHRKNNSFQPAEERKRLLENIQPTVVRSGKGETLQSQPIPYEKKDDESEMSFHHVLYNVQQV